MFYFRNCCCCYCLDFFEIAKFVLYNQHGGGMVPDWKLLWYVWRSIETDVSVDSTQHSDGGDVSQAKMYIKQYMSPVLLVLASFFSCISFLCSCLVTPLINHSSVSRKIEQCWLTPILSVSRGLVLTDKKTKTNPLSSSVYYYFLKLFFKIRKIARAKITLLLIEQTVEYRLQGSVLVNCSMKLGIRSLWRET